LRSPSLMAIRTAKPAPATATPPAAKPAPARRAAKKDGLPPGGPWLDFERPIVELEVKIQDIRAHAAGTDLALEKELAALEARAEKLRHKVYDNLTRYQRVQLARHPKRPYLMDFVDRLMTDFVELHGDRAFADDHAIVGGLARLGGEPLLVVGTQKGRDT